MNETIFDLRDLSLKTIIRELKKYLVIIVLLSSASFLLTTSLGMLTYQPKYESKATLAIGVTGYSDYTGLQMATNMTDVFSQVFSSSALQNKIQKKTGEKLNATITTQVVDETNLLTLTATASHPRQAYLYLQKAIENYHEVSGYVFSNAVLNTVQEPSVPQRPVNQSIFIKYRGLITLLTALIVIVVVLVNYCLRFTVKSVYGAKRLLDGHILGIIEEVNKRKNDNHPLVLTSSLLGMEFLEQVHMTTLQVERHLKKNQQQVLLITSVMENEGKSSFSTNIAISLSEKGKKVLLIDGDLRRPSIRHALRRKIKNRHSLTEVIENKSSYQETIIHEKRIGIDVMYQFKAIDNPDIYMNTDRLTQLLSELKKMYDYIIIDTSPVSVSREAEVWMQVADTGLLVVRQDWSDIRAVNDAVDLIWQNTGDFAGFVLNAFTSSLDTNWKGGYNGTSYNTQQ